MANILPFEYLTTNILAQTQSMSGEVLTDALEFDEIRSPTCSLVVSAYSGSIDITVQFSKDGAAWEDSGTSWTQSGRMSVVSIIRNINYSHVRLKLDGTAELTGVYSLSRHRRFPASIQSGYHAYIADAEVIDSAGDYVCGSTDGFPYCLPVTLS